VGKYAVAEVGRDSYIEVIYFPELASAGGRIGDFNRIKRGHLKDNYQLVYLYLIEPGARIVKFTPGGNAQPVDLSDENLVAR